MIIRTGLIKVSVPFDDMLFHMVELDTTKEADLAVKSITSSGSAVKGKFVQAVESWENVSNIDGPMECTEENKGILFDCNKDVIESVMAQYIDLIEKGKEAEKKIFQNGARGTLKENKSIATPAGT